MMRFLHVEIQEGGADTEEFTTADVEKVARSMWCAIDDRDARLRRFCKVASPGDVFEYGKGLVFAINNDPYWERRDNG